MKTAKADQKATGDRGSAFGSVARAMVSAYKKRAFVSAAAAKCRAAEESARGVVDGLFTSGCGSHPTLRQAMAIQALGPEFEFSATISDDEVGRLFEACGVDASLHEERVDGPSGACGRRGGVHSLHGDGGV